MAESRAMLFHSAPGAGLWPAAMIVWGPGYASSLHRHHCVQIVMALRGTLRIRGGSTRRWAHCAAALVRTDADHEVDATGTKALIGFVDAESALGAALAARIPGDIAIITPREASQWRAALNVDAASGELRVERWIMDFLRRRPQVARIHPGVKRVLRHLRANLGATDDVSLPNLARIAGLSESRFMHVFTEGVHVALRPYILWLRLQRASGALMGNASIREAAQRAGFADASHMTRTFRRMLGTTPREITRRRDGARGSAIEER